MFLLRLIWAAVPFRQGGRTSNASNRLGRDVSLLPSRRCLAYSLGNPLPQHRSARFLDTTPMEPPLRIWDGVYQRVENVGRYSFAVRLSHPLLFGSYWSVRKEFLTLPLTPSRTLVGRKPQT